MQHVNIRSAVNYAPAAASTEKATLIIQRWPSCVTFICPPSKPTALHPEPIDLVILNRETLSNPLETLKRNPRGEDVMPGFVDHNY
jgi:hypothetical protein